MKTKLSRLIVFWFMSIFVIAGLGFQAQAEIKVKWAHWAPPKGSAIQAFKWWIQHYRWREKLFLENVKAWHLELEFHGRQCRNLIHV